MTKRDQHRCVGLFFRGESWARPGNYRLVGFLGGKLGMYHPNLAGRTKKAKRFSGDEKSGRYIGLDVTGKLAGVRLFLADREIWAKQTFL